MKTKDKNQSKNDSYYDGHVIVRDIPFEQLLEEIRLEEERCKTITSWDECM